MRKLYNAVEFDNLLYHYKGPTKDIDFSKYNDAKILFDMIKNKDQFIQCRRKSSKLKIRTK